MLAHLHSHRPVLLDRPRAGSWRRHDQRALRVELLLLVCFAGLVQSIQFGHPHPAATAQTALERREVQFLRTVVRGGGAVWPRQPH